MRDATYYLLTVIMLLVGFTQFVIGEPIAGDQQNGKASVGFVGGTVVPSVTYYNDFEHTGKMVLGPNNLSKYELSFMDISREKAHSGESSLKLDFSVSRDATGHYSYWYLKLPNHIPLRDPTYLQAFVWGTEGKGCLGVEFEAIAENKRSQPAFRKASGFGEWQREWKKVFINIYPEVVSLCDRYGWDTGKSNLVVTAVFIKVTQKSPYRETIYLDDVCVDYLQHNPEAMGLPMKDLYRIVKKKMTILRVRLNKAFMVNVNENAKVEDKRLWTQLSHIGAQIADTSTMSADQLADMRIQLDKLSAEYQAIVENEEFEVLFR